MASGLIALLDDVAVIAKMAAASVDDVAAATATAGAKSAGVVIDDAAVTPAYVTGFSPERELPMIWKIAKGSLRNKLLILLPGFMALAAFWPQALTPLLMLGGAYLCFEAAEKVMEKLGHAAPATALNMAEGAAAPADAAEQESAMVKGAIRTDLILSAEILAIALGALGTISLATKAAALVAVSIIITALVYGGVALIVKMDDFGLRLAGRPSALAQRIGRALVAGMPKLLAALAVIGTAAMAWVGGGIVVHGLETTGLFPAIPHLFQQWAAQAGQAVPAASGAVEWTAHAVLAGLFGLVLGAVVAQPLGLWHRFRHRNERMD